MSFLQIICIGFSYWCLISIFPSSIFLSPYHPIAKLFLICIYYLWTINLKTLKEICMLITHVGQWWDLAGNNSVLFHSCISSFNSRFCQVFHNVASLCKLWQMWPCRGLWGSSVLGHAKCWNPEVFDCTLQPHQQTVLYSFSLWLWNTKTSLN